MQNIKKQNLGIGNWMGKEIIYIRALTMKTNTRLDVHLKCKFSFVFSYLFIFSPEDGTKENAVNVTLTSKASTEPTANDFQDFVSDMQKTITSLRKQVGYPGYDLNDTHSLKLHRANVFSHSRINTLENHLLPSICNLC